MISAPPDNPQPAITFLKIPLHQTSEVFGNPGGLCKCEDISQNRRIGLHRAAPVLCFFGGTKDD